MIAAPIIEWVYVLGYSTIEPDLLFFRATDMNRDIEKTEDLRSKRKGKGNAEERITGPSREND